MSPSSWSLVVLCGTLAGPVIIVTCVFLLSWRSFYTDLGFVASNKKRKPFLSHEPTVLHCARTRYIPGRRKKYTMEPPLPAHSRCSYYYNYWRRCFGGEGGRRSSFRPPALVRALARRLLELNKEKGKSNKVGPRQPHHHSKTRSCSSSSAASTSHPRCWEGSTITPSARATAAAAVFFAQEV